MPQTHITVHEMSCETRCYKITTMRVAVALDCNTVYGNMQRIQQILTFKFLEVVQQYILGVVGNVIHCFVANLIGFRAVKEFRKSVKI